MLFKGYPRKLPSAVVGMAGEIMVWKKLWEHDIPFIPKGGQAGFDVNLDRPIRNKIEVRTARCFRHKDDTREWGWPAQKNNKREKDGVNYDFLVCVALGDDLKIGNTKFYFFTKNQVMRRLREVHNPRYQNVRRKIAVYESYLTFLADYNNKKNKSSFSRFEKEINEKPEEFMDWGILMAI
jgi:hypothetical protein